MPTHIVLLLGRNSQPRDVSGVEMTREKGWKGTLEWPNTSKYQLSPLLAITCYNLPTNGLEEPCKTERCFELRICWRCSSRMLPLTWLDNLKQNIIKSWPNVNYNTSCMLNTVHDIEHNLPVAHRTIFFYTWMVVTTGDPNRTFDQTPRSAPRGTRNPGRTRLFGLVFRLGSLEALG